MQPAGIKARTPAIRARRIPRSLSAVRLPIVHHGVPTIPTRVGRSRMMSGQLKYVQSYAAMVEANFAAYPEAEAVAISVGGEFERIGALELALLRQQGLGA